MVVDWYGVVFSKMEVLPSLIEEPLGLRKHWMSFAKQHRKNHAEQDGKLRNKMANCRIA